MTTAVESALTRLSLDTNPPTARISLRHPPLNVIDVPMMDELFSALSDVGTRPDISIILISGEGASFSAGVDVPAHTPDKVEEMLSKFHAVIRAVIATSKITIASVHGNCLGGGAELAMACDMVYTTSSSRWGFPEIKLGCFPPVACAALAVLVGQKRAAELILTGRTISGDEAADIGLATRALSEDALPREVEQIVSELSRLSASSLAITKKAFYSWDAMHFDKGLARAEKVYFEDLMKSSDAREGIAAFMEKRQPEWLGR